MEMSSSERKSTMTDGIQNFLHLRRPEIVPVIDRWAKHIAFVLPLLLELLIGRFGLRETGLGQGDLLPGVAAP